MNLDLGLGSSPPAAKKRKRVASHKSVGRVESLPLPEPTRPQRSSPGGAPRGRGSSPALALDLDAAPPSSARQPRVSPSVKPVSSGRGIAPNRAVVPSKVREASIPPAPDDKPGLFRSNAPGSSDAPPPSVPSLAPPAPTSQRKPAPAANPAGAPAGNLFGDDDDDDDDWEGGGALNVGLDYGSEFPPPMSQGKPAAASADDDDDLGAPSMDLADPGPHQPPPSAAAASGAGAAPPAGALPRGGALPPGGGPASQQAAAGPVFSPQEIEVVAQFGPLPSNPLLTPLYAFKVYQRKRELEKLLTLQTRTHEQATTTLRQKLADIADVIIAKAPEQLDGVMGPIRTADQKIADRKVQLEAASGQFASQFKSLQLELEGESRKRQQLDRDKNMAQIKLEDAVHKRAQVTAELKRVNMQIETAHQAAAAAAGDNAAFAPPEHARKITQLEAQKAKLIEQVRGRDKAVTDAKAELREREGAIKLLETRVHAIHGRQSRMENESGQAQSTGLNQLKMAQNERLVAYEVAIDTILAQAASLVDKPTKAQINDVKRQLAVCDADLQKHKIAINAYDDKSFKTGVAIVIGAAVVLLLLLISVGRVQ